MEHPTQYVLRVTRFLDGLINEHGDYLFMGFVYGCILLLVWMVIRPREQPVHDVSIVILPLGHSPKRAPEPEPVLFQEPSDF